MSYMYWLERILSYMPVKQIQIDAGNSKPLTQTRLVLKMYSRYIQFCLYCSVLCLDKDGRKPSMKFNFF